jgi:hypothetical protein
MYLAMLLVVSVLSAGVQAAVDPSGRWEGKIMIPEREMSLVVDLARTPAGPWIGSLSIPLSTSIDVPLGTITIEGTVVTFTAMLPGKATFEGKVSADGRSLSGTAANAEGSAPFQLVRTGDASVKLPPASSPLPKEFAGAWEGTVDVSGTVKRIGLRLSAAPDGTAVGVLISSEPGAPEIPVTVVTVKGAQLSLESRAVSGTFTGTLGDTGEIAGEWTQRTTRLPLRFRKIAARK